MKVFESEKTFAFLDINPLSYGHAVSVKLRKICVAESDRSW